MYYITAYRLVLTLSELLESIHPWFGVDECLLLINIMLNACTHDNALADAISTTDINCMPKHYDDSRVGLPGVMGLKKGWPKWIHTHLYQATYALIYLHIYHLSQGRLL